MRGEERQLARVDVVIPTIGRDSLVRAVDCVLAQSVPARPIVVLDVPQKLETVRKLLEGRDYTILVTDGGAKAAAARNLGLDHVNADFVSFLDDDDWWGDKRLERLIRAVGLAEHAGGVLAGSRFHFMLPDGSHRVVPEQAPDVSTREATLGYLIRRTALKFGHTAMQTSTLLVSSDLAKQVRWRQDLRKHQDWDFILRLLRVDGVEFVWANDDECFVQKDSPGSISKRMDWEASLAWIESLTNPYLNVRERSDFLWIHVLRAALAQRSMTGIIQFLRARPTRPHAAAVVLGLSGAVQLLGLKR